jgi:hypothetical protein
MNPALFPITISVLTLSGNYVEASDSHFESVSFRKNQGRAIYLRTRKADLAVVSISFQNVMAVASVITCGGVMNLNNRSVL